mgnify:CR=1 FL=1
MVLHSNFGQGTIMKVDEKSQTYDIRFDFFPDTIRRIRFRAPLIKLWLKRKTGDREKKGKVGVSTNTIENTRKVSLVQCDCWNCFHSISKDGVLDCK